MFVGERERETIEKMFFFSCVFFFLPRVIFVF